MTVIHMLYAVQLEMGCTKVAEVTQILFIGSTGVGRIFFFVGDVIQESVDGHKKNVVNQSYET